MIEPPPRLSLWREELKMGADWFEKLWSRLPRQLTLTRELFELGMVD